MYLTVQAHFVLCLLLSNDKFHIHSDGSLEYYMNEWKWEYIRRVQPTRYNVSQFIYFCKTLYMFRKVFPSIIRSSKLHIQRQVLVWPLLLPAVSLARLTAGSTNGLTLCVQFSNLFISVRRCTCFGRFFLPSWAQNCTYSFRPLLLPAVSLARLTAGSSNGQTLCVQFSNLFISVRRSTCFRRFFLPSWDQNCTYSVRYWSDRYCYLLLAWPG